MNNPPLVLPLSATRDNGTKRSAGINGNKRRLLQAASTRWLNCASRLQSKQRYSMSALIRRRTEEESTVVDRVGE